MTTFKEIERKIVIDDVTHCLVSEKFRRNMKHEGCVKTTALHILIQLSVYGSLNKTKMLAGEPTIG